MTIREAMGDTAGVVQRRLDQVLDSEDALIVLVDRHGTTSYCHGFGASGCQLELLGHALEQTLHTMGSVLPGPRPATTEFKEAQPCRP